MIKKNSKQVLDMEKKYTKAQFLNRENPTYNLDAMYVVLEDDKTYSEQEAMGLYNDFMNKKLD